MGCSIYCGCSNSSVRAVVYIAAVVIRPVRAVVYIAAVLIRPLRAVVSYCCSNTSSTGRTSVTSDIYGLFIHANF